MRSTLTALAALALLASPATAGMDPFTRTAEGVRPALEEICSRSQTQTEEPAFMRRMIARHGLEADGDLFRRTGDDGELVVGHTGVGCTILITGDAAMIAQADRELVAFATRARLTSQVSDETVSGEDGRRISRERSTPGRGFLNWQVFDDFNGRNKPSRIEGVYSRHAH